LLCCFFLFFVVYFLLGLERRLQSAAERKGAIERHADASGGGL